MFSTAEKNPYQGIPLGVAQRFGSASLPLFSLGETDMLANTFRQSGLRDVTVRALSIRRHFSSTAEMIRMLKESAVIRAPIEKLDEARRDQAWAETERQLSALEGPNGVEVPGEFLIGAEPSENVSMIDGLRDGNHEGATEADSQETSGHRIENAPLSQYQRFNPT